MDCLAGCVGSKKCKEIQKPVDGETQSPFVVITFAPGNGQSITVGNESAPSYQHHAVIKSFEWANSDGFKGEVEILDEEGGMFESFVRKMVHKMDGNASMDQNSSLVTVQFGWIVARCDGTTNRISSPILYGHPIHMDVTFADGKVKYKIHIADLMQVVFSAREDSTHGKDEAPLELQKAIRKMMNETEPRQTVLFQRREKSGTLTNWKYRTKTESTWSTDQQNKLAAAMKWHQPFRTDHDKGVAPMADSTQIDTIIMLEDVKPDCNEEPGCEQSVGTFLVNGGNCSNVISFSPTINWAKTWGVVASVGGTVGGPLVAKSVQTKKPCGLTSQAWKSAGTMEAILPSKYALEVHGTEEWAEQVAYSTKANNAAVDTGTAIEAELKIQGDPKYSDFVHIKGKTASLVVLNPFHLKGGGECGDWLAIPLCNAVLSNKNWTIMQVAHSIREGSYVTTMKIRLAVPESTLPEDAKLGNDPQGWAR